MKRLINMMTGAVMLLGMMTSCGKEPAADTVDKAIVGEWHLAEVIYDGNSVNDIPVDVYLKIEGNCKFELYQKAEGQLRYTKFTGTCKTENGILSGVYSSGTAWGDEYATAIVDEMLELTNSDMLEVQRFEKNALSDEEKADAVLSTRADMDISPIL